MSKVSVYGPGTDVRIQGNTPARISQVCIKEGPSVSYEVVYWVDGNRKTSWVNLFEINSVDLNKGQTEIGFKTSENPLQSEGG